MKINKLLYAAWYLLLISASSIFSMEEREKEEATAVETGLPIEDRGLYFLESSRYIRPPHAMITETIKEMNKLVKKNVPNVGGTFIYRIRLFDLKEMDEDLQYLFMIPAGGIGKLDSNKLSNMASLHPNYPILQALNKYITDLIEAKTDPEKIIAFQIKNWTESMRRWMENPYEQIAQEIKARERREYREKVVWYHKLSQKEMVENIIYHSFAMDVDSQLLNYGYLHETYKLRGEMKIPVYIPGSIEIIQKTFKGGENIISQNYGHFEYIFIMDRFENLRLIHRFFKKIEIGRVESKLLNITMPIIEERHRLKLQKEALEGYSKALGLQKASLALRERIAELRERLVESIAESRERSKEQAKLIKEETKQAI